MATICPECGDALKDASSCQEIFDSFLAMEFSDPTYGKVHMLTVACFMIQHGRYSDASLVWIEQQLREHLENDKPIEQIRQDAARSASQASRKEKILRYPGAPNLPAIHWSMRIGTVASHYHDAESYCQLVQQWARATLAEMQPWISTRPISTL